MEIEMISLITNGMFDEESAKSYKSEGFICLGSAFASVFHPYAMDSDRIYFFAKPMSKEEYDKKILERNKDEVPTCNTRKDSCCEFSQVINGRCIACEAEYKELIPDEIN